MTHVDPRGTNASGRRLGRPALAIVAALLLLASLLDRSPRGVRAGVGARLG